MKEQIIDSVLKESNLNFAKKDPVIVKIFFNDDKLKNLWKQELSGQFSDGMFENNNRAKWLWQNVTIENGPKNEIVIYSGNPGEKNFSFNSLLKIPEVKERMMNLFDDEKEMYSALGTISSMIFHAKKDDSNTTESPKPRDKTVLTEDEVREQKLYYTGYSSKDSKQVTDKINEMKKKFPGHKIVKVKKPHNPLSRSYDTRPIYIIYVDDDTINSNS